MFREKVANEIRCSGTTSLLAGTAVLPYNMEGVYTMQDKPHAYNKGSTSVQTGGGLLCVRITHQRVHAMALWLYVCSGWC